MRATTGFLERRTSRRGFLVRATAVGTALAVSPVRYLMRPEDALAIVTPSQCGASRRCRRSRYTEFCCTLRDRNGRASGKNYCPSWTVVAGWWKCSPYQGRQICRGRKYRYYIDCDVKRGVTCRCRCVGGKCRHRKMCCNPRAYRNCNAGGQSAGVVACRIVRCRRPDKLTSKCSSRGPRDDPTCRHEACCNCGDCGCTRNSCDDVTSC
jgi:hypothetical protein